MSVINLERYKNYVNHSAQHSLVIINPARFDWPIEFVSDEFFEMTGYRRADIIGQNCRFLRGPETNLSTIARLHHAINHYWPVTVDILLYKRSGEPYWCRVRLQPCFNANAGIRIPHCIGIHSLITKPDPHYLP